MKSQLSFDTRTMDTNGRREREKSRPTRDHGVFHVEELPTSGLFNGPPTLWTPNDKSEAEVHIHFPLRSPHHHPSSWWEGTSSGNSVETSAGTEKNYSATRIESIQEEGRAATVDVASGCVVCGTQWHQRRSAGGAAVMHVQGTNETTAILMPSPFGLPLE